MEIVRKIWNFKFLGTVLFLIGCYAYNNLGEEHTGIYAEIERPLLWGIPLGIGIGLYRIISNFSRYLNKSENPVIASTADDARPITTDSTSSQSLTPQQKGKNAITAGIIMIVLGLVVAISPLLVAMLGTAPGHNMWSEGDSQSAGAAIWMLLITVPVGGSLAVVGIVMSVIGAAKAAKLNK